ncbi:MAG: DUF3857 domain-containing protein [Bacillota bacterium]
MKKITYSLLFLMLFTMLSTTAVAQKSPEDLLKEAPNQFYYPAKNAVVWKEEKVFDYSEQPYLENCYRAIKIFNRQGAEEYQQITINYHPQWQEVEVTQAQIIKPSGTVVNISADQIKDKAIQYTPDNTQYRSQYQKIINFSEVETDALIIYSYQKKIKKTLIPGEIQIVDSINSHQGEIVVKVPLGKNIYTRVKPTDKLNGPTISRKGKTEIYTWEGYKPQAKLHISSLESWQEFSNWYKKLLPQADQFTQELNRKVKELTTGLATEKEKIKALYNYVAVEIKHIDHQLGVNGYQPLPLNKIYQQQAAVAKDKVYFLTALLKKIGVKAQPVVMNRHKSFDSVIVAADFNHFLVYLPKYDLYLDPVFGFARYNNLSLDTQGKKVLNLMTGQLSTTPILNKNINQENVKQVIDLKENGAAEIRMQLKSRGFYDFIAKAIFRGLNPIGRQEMMHKILEKYYTKLQFSKMNINGIKGLAEQSEFDLSFEVQDYYKKQQDKIKIKAFNTPLSLLLSIADAQNTLPCRINKQIIINIPDGYDVQLLPENKKVNNYEGQLKVDYQKKEQQLIIDLDYQFNKLANVESVSWFYIEELFNNFKEIKDKTILLKK